MKTKLCIILMGIGVALFTYPLFSNLWNQYINKNRLSDYEKAVLNMDIDHEWEQAETFNRNLKEHWWNLNEDMKEQYEHILDVNGVMAEIEIPKIGVDLPIYHGTDTIVLQTGAGHMEGTSLPIGGEGHAVITGHTGLASAKLFSDLDKLEQDDLFIIKVLGKELYYKVNEIRVILPDEIDCLKLEEDVDKVTLVTCTPKGVNSHRLLVTGIRVNEKNKEHKINWFAVIIGTSVLIITIKKGRKKE